MGSEMCIRDSPGTALVACSQPAGFVLNNLDCDDGNATTNPTSFEVCDGVDNNCTGGVDEAGALNATNWYVDADGDGYGIAGTPQSSCTQPTGYADNTADCNDDPANGGADVHPDASEVCNSIDDDCDGTVDDGAVDATVWYADLDGDQYGDVDSTVLSCSQPTGTVQDATDCNDLEATAYPGAVELCDSLDNDCNDAVDDGLALGGGVLCAAPSCEAIYTSLSGGSLADGTYWLDPTGSDPFEVHCDMTEGGWALVYNMCQNNGGSALAGDLQIESPVLPTANFVTSLGYTRAADIGAAEVRFGSDFTPGGYIFSWSTLSAISNPGPLEQTLNGTPHSNLQNACAGLGQALPGSTGDSCSNLQIGHNYNPSSSIDTWEIPSLGCGCHPWGSFRWGSIDRRDSCSGVVHSSSNRHCSNNPQTSNGCINIYLK